MTCFNFNITGSGSAAPQGTRFPGAYAADEPGFHFDIYDDKSTAAYPSVGPPLWRGAAGASTAPGSGPPRVERNRVIISPTQRGAAADAEYYRWQNAAIARQVAIDTALDAIGG